MATGMTLTQACDFLRQSLIVGTPSIVMNMSYATCLDRLTLYHMGTPLQPGIAGWPGASICSNASASVYNQQISYLLMNMGSLGFAYRLNQLYWAAVNTLVRPVAYYYVACPTTVAGVVVNAWTLRWASNPPPYVSSLKPPPPDWALQSESPPPSPPSPPPSPPLPPPSPPSPPSPPYPPPAPPSSPDPPMPPQPPLPPPRKPKHPQPLTAAIGL